MFDVIDFAVSLFTCTAYIGVFFYVIACAHLQSFDDSEDDFAADTPKKRKATKKEAATPAEASKAEIAKIEAELTKILKDEANDSMTYAGTIALLCGGPVG